jgi:hypothetical protein
LAVSFLLFAACRSEFRDNDDTGANSSSSTGATSDTGDTGDTGEETCDECQDAWCNAYAEACLADPTCAACLDTPYSTGCANHDDFRKLAACSCSQCASSCGFLCPAGQGACQACGVTECLDESSTCAGDSSCGPCLEDPNSAGCDTNPDFDAFLGCACGVCGQQCLWQCPDAYGTCAQCALAQCGAQYAACLMDEVCAACSENPLAEGCMQNELSQATVECVCANCDGDCGILFQCDQLG